MKNVVLVIIGLIAMNVLLSCATGPAEAFDIVKNGKANSVVILKTSATAAEVYAANEFVRYIEKITGATLKISAGDIKTSEPKVYIRANGNKSDKVYIYAKGNALYLEGDSPAAAIYAVYEYLVKYLGAEFYTHEIEKIPTLKTISVKANLKYEYASPFFSRESFFKCNTAFPEFAVKQRLNGHFNEIPDNMGGHVQLHLWCHSTMFYMPEDKYYKDHPEYYALVKGQRMAGGAGQLCFTNENMRKELAKNVIAYLDTQNNPKIVDVSQMDNTNMCECENCVKAEEKYGSPAGALLETINYVASEVKKKYPDTQVETLAYQKTVPAPKGIKAEDNVIIRICDIEDNISEPIAEKSNNGPYVRIKATYFGYVDDQTVNRDFANNLEAWGNICNQLYVWDYVVNFANFYLAQPNMHVLKPNLQYFRDNKVIAVFEQGDNYNYHATFNELKNFLLGKLLWNPDEDVDKLKEDFCQAVYGEGAEEILEIIDIFTNTPQKLHLSTPCNILDMSWLPIEDYIKSVKLFQKALEKTENNPAANAKILSLYYDYLYGWYLMTGDTSRRVREECNLPWDRIDFYEMFLEYTRKNEDDFIGEGRRITDSFKPTELKKSGNVPDECKGLEDKDWCEIQNNTFKLLSIGKETDDQSASNGSATLLYPTQGEWSMQCVLTGNLNEWKKAGKTGMDIYVVCKSVDKKNDKGYCISCGIWDPGSVTNRFLEHVKISQLNDNTWTTVNLGYFDFKDCRDAHIYLCGVNNPDCAEAVAIDRVFGVLK